MGAEGHQHLSGSCPEKVRAGTAVPPVHITSEAANQGIAQAYLWFSLPFPSRIDRAVVENRIHLFIGVASVSDQSSVSIISCPRVMHLSSLRRKQRCSLPFLTLCFSGSQGGNMLDLCLFVQPLTFSFILSRLLLEVWYYTVAFNVLHRLVSWLLPWNIR